MRKPEGDWSQQTSTRAEAQRELLGRWMDIVERPNSHIGLIPAKIAPKAHAIYVGLVDLNR